MPYKNKEDYIRYHQEYRNKHKEEKKIFNKKYREGNLEKLNIYQKKYYREYYKTFLGRQVQRKSAKNQRIRNAEKIAARKKLAYEVEYGRIKKLPCRDCGKLEVHGHHEDYNKPLDVVWLCQNCHNLLHGRHVWKSC